MFTCVTLPPQMYLLKPGLVVQPGIVQDVYEQIGQVARLVCHRLAPDDEVGRWIFLPSDVRGEGGNTHAACLPPYPFSQLDEVFLVCPHLGQAPGRIKAFNIW